MVGVWAVRVCKETLTPVFLFGRKGYPAPVPVPGCILIHNYSHPGGNTVRLRGNNTPGEFELPASAPAATLNSRRASRRLKQLERKLKHLP